MTDTRHKNIDWSISGAMTYDGATIAVLMDIRDELQALRSLANCYRIPRALDALIEAGAEARRKKRAAARRKKAKG
jgi:ABC-type transporter Mla MlaB component